MPRSILVTTALPKAEKVFYYLYLFVTISYGVYVSTREASDFKQRFRSGTWLGFKFRRDPSYYTWDLYIKFFVESKNLLSLYSVTILHFILKSQLSQRYKKITAAVLSLAFMVFTFGLKAFLIPFLSMSFLYFVTKAFKSKLIVWISTILTMVAFDSSHYNKFVEASFNELKLNESYDYIYKTSMFFLILRLVGFCLDKIDFELANNIDTQFNYLSLFAYTFYPSFICNSAYIRFNDFYLSLIDENPVDWKCIGKLMIRILLSFLLIELVLHTTLTYAIHNDLYLIEQVSKYSLAMSLMFKGALFSCTYVVFYGIPKICNELVGMRTTPLPVCVALIHTNSEMWKMFDTGMYEFIKHYLYIPMGGNRMSIVRQFGALGISFAYLSYWHGAILGVSLWSLANFVMVLTELCYFKYVARNHFFAALPVLTKQRAACVLLGFWQLNLHIFAFFFLSSVDVTFAIYKRLIFEQFPTAVLIGGLGYYCNAQLRLIYKKFVY